MSSDSPWNLFTSTVGLVVTSSGERLNVQSAEWTYAVARAPFTIAVVLHEKNWTTSRLAQLEQFSVTLCSDAQADVADFCGGFSGRDIEKFSSADITLAKPATIATPWITGGVAAFECVVSQRVALPQYTMVIAEVHHIHAVDEPPDPLVKHGGMYTLGTPAIRDRVTAGTARLSTGVRVAAVSAGSDVEPYEVVALDQHGAALAASTSDPNQYGDLDCILRLPDSAIDAIQSVEVSRGSHRPGRASVARVELGDVQKPCQVGDHTDKKGGMS